jgi:dihydrofolate synthase/folylpolyglutamate synthase
MPIETYEQAVAFWNSRINYEKIGMPQDMGALKLDRMRLLLEHLGNPQDRYRCVHVTGTKGKGSTATMIASVLQAAGYRVGLYTSPHLVHIEERVQVNKQPIDRMAMTRCMNEVAVACEQVEAQGESPPTFFEIITAVGFLHFAHSKVDLAVLEVGMGGRFDATNVVDPLVSIITSISLDHIEQLGSTLESIASEKAGIIKRHRPIVSGVREAGPAEVIRQVASEQQSPLYRLGVEFDRDWQPGDVTKSIAPQVKWTSPDDSSPWYQLTLWGRHQADNAAIAIQSLKLVEQAGIKLTSEAYVQGLSQAVIPGRLEIFHQSPWHILDAAHNAASIGVLLDWLKLLPAQRYLFLFAVSKDKQIRDMLQLLVPHNSRIIFTRYSSSTRGGDPNHLLQLWHELGGTHAEVVDHPALGWETLTSQAKSTDVVCATGSVFLVGEIRQHLLAKTP